MPGIDGTVIVRPLLLRELLRQPYFLPPVAGLISERVTISPSCPFSGSASVHETRCSITESTVIHAGESACRRTWKGSYIGWEKEPDKGLFFLTPDYILRQVITGSIKRPKAHTAYFNISPWEF